MTYKSEEQVALQKCRRVCMQPPLHRNHLIQFACSSGKYTAVSSHGNHLTQSACSSAKYAVVYHLDQMITLELFMPLWVPVRHCQHWCGNAHMSLATQTVSALCVLVATQSLFQAASIENRNTQTNSQLRFDRQTAVNVWGQSYGRNSQTNQKVRSIIKHWKLCLHPVRLSSTRNCCKTGWQEPAVLLKSLPFCQS